MRNMRRSRCASRSSTRRSSARAAASSRAIRSGRRRRPSYGRSGARPAANGCSRRSSRLPRFPPRGPSLRGAGEQRRDAPNGDAAVFPRGPGRLYLELLGAVALRGQILGRHLEILAEDDGDGFGATVRKRQIVDVVADRVGVALHQEHLVGIALDHGIDPLGDIREQRNLIREDLPRSELESDGIEIDPPHAVAQRRAEANLVARVGALDPLGPTEQAEAFHFVVAHEYAAALANDHAVIGLLDHGALPVVLDALLALLAQRLELLLLLARIDGGSTGATRRARQGL